jgi:hypothetical protein
MKSEQSVRSMSTGMNTSGEMAPHLVYWNEKL